jgi:hypothetical protein
MKNLTRIILLLTLTLGFTGCWDSKTESAAEDMSEKVEEVGEDMADKTQEMTEEASESVEDVTEDVSEEN